MQKALYLLVADGGRAKVYQADKRLRGGIELVYEEANPAGHKHRAFVTDKGGMRRGGAGIRHSMGDRDAGERHEMEVFARNLSKFLLKERQRGKYERLMIAAPPQFLGDLRHNLSHECRNVLARTINKDLTKADDRELISQFSAEII